MCLLENPFARLFLRCRVSAQAPTPKRARTAAPAPMPIPALAPTGSPAGSLDSLLSSGADVGSASSVSEVGIVVDAVVGCAAPTPDEVVADDVVIVSN